MKVAFSRSLWSEPEKYPAGRPQYVDWSYIDGEVKRYIPVVYRFAEGVVFDVLTPLNDDALQEYFARCAKVDEACLTEMERRCLEQEHPYGSPEIRNCRINGSEPVEEDAAGTLLLSDRLAKSLTQDNTQEDALNALLRREQKALVGQSSFGCYRVRLKFGPPHSRKDRLCRALRCYKLSELAFETAPKRRLYPAKLELTESQGLEEGGVLQNPVTGTLHKVCLSHIRREVLELPGGAYYCSSALYEAIPPLPQGQRLIFDNTLQQLPEQRASRTLPANAPAIPHDAGQFPKGAADPMEASLQGSAAIGIIGGADGPTAVFVAKGEKDTPVGAHGLPTGICTSAPSWDPRQSRIFRVVGVECMEHEAQKILLGQCEKNKG